MSRLELLLFGAACYAFGFVSGTVRERDGVGYPRGGSSSTKTAPFVLLRAARFAQ